MKKCLLILMFFVWQINVAQNNLSPTGNVGIGTVDPLSKLTVAGSITINGGLNNTLTRPAILASTSEYGEIRAYSMHGNVSDDGFLRLSAGGGTTPWAKTYIDISGYSVVPDMNRNIVFGTSGGERMRIDQAGNIGIGTASPDAKLVVNGDVKVKENLFISGSSGGYTGGDNPVLYFGVNNGFAKINVPFGDKMILSSYHGYTFNTSYNGTTALPSLTIGITGDVGIGTINPDAKLTVAGNIHAREVKITVNAGVVPDYVFANGYKLKSLQEVEEYIKKNSHLPEIPSAKEIEKNGLMLAEMNMGLLKKMEEMTLYMIEQDKEMKNLKKENEILKSFSERLSKIENELLIK
jgi:hypothetical protein